MLTSNINYLIALKLYIQIYIVQIHYRLNIYFSALLRTWTKQIYVTSLIKLSPFPPTHSQSSQYELKDSPGSHPASLPVHAAQGFYPYGQYPYGDPSRAKAATRETTSTLKAWLQEHQKNPYPTKGEKIMLAIITRMTLTQVGSLCLLSSFSTFTFYRISSVFMQV